MNHFYSNHFKSFCKDRFKRTGSIGKGVSEQDYHTFICELAGGEMNAIFEYYVCGTRPFEGILTEAFEVIGIEMIHQPSRRYSHGRLGFKTIPDGAHHVVKAIYPGSPADLEHDAHHQE